MAEQFSRQVEVQTSEDATTITMDGGSAEFLVGDIGQTGSGSVAH